MRRLSVALLCLMAVAACHKAPDKTDATKAPAPAKPAVPVALSFAQNDADAQVNLTLPPAIAAFPDLHARLFQSGHDELTDFIATAHHDRAQNSADGIEEPAYYRSIEWKAAARTPQLVSFYAQENEYQGGAHGGLTFQTVLWDIGGNAPVDAKGLFAPGADMGALNAYVCHQVEAERSKRAGTPLSQRGSGLSCPNVLDSRLALLPSTQMNQAGGIDLLFAPSEVAPYAEGPFEVQVPQAQFRDLIVPRFAGAFGGEPVKTTLLSDPNDP